MGRLMDDRDLKRLHHISEGYFPEINRERRSRLLEDKDLRAGRDILCYSKDDNNVLIRYLI